MKLTKLIAASTFFIAANSMAFNESEQIIFKIRANYTSSDSKLGGLPAPKSSTPLANGKLFSTAYGADGSATLFLTDNIAGEFSTGLTLYKAKNSAISSVAYNYNTNQQASKKRNIYFIPSALTLQFHIAPYGAIRPYVGGGYHYTYIIQRAKEYKLKNAGGAVLQGGVDIVLQDDTYINLDAKYYMLKTKASFNKSFAVDKDSKQVTSKMKLNPFSIGIGLGFKL